MRVSKDLLGVALLGGALSAAAACGARSSVLEREDVEDDGTTTTTTSTGTTTTTWTTTTTSWTTSTTTTSTTTTTTTITPTGACDQPPNDCLDCGLCFIGTSNSCPMETAACLGDPPCEQVTECVINCHAGCEGAPQPDTCFETCINGPGGCSEQFTEGVEGFNAMIECIVVQDCTVTCQ